MLFGLKREASNSSFAARSLIPTVDLFDATRGESVVER